MRMTILAVWALIGGVFSAAFAQPSVPASPAGEADGPAVQADAYYHFLMGRRLEASGEIEGAVRELERAAALDPQGAEIHAELATLYARHDRIREALTAAQEALIIDPVNRQAHRVAGTIYGALADAPPGRDDQREVREQYLAQAVFHLERAAADGVVDPGLQLSLGRLYTRAGEYERAVPPLVRLLEVEGWSPDAVLLLAQAYAGGGRTGEAIGLLEEALAVDPRFYRGMVQLAELYDRERRWLDAAALYDRASRENPRNPELPMRRALALLNAGRPGDARDMLRLTLEAFPAETSGLYLLALAERNLGELEAAERTARRLIAADEADLRGPSVLAELLARRRDHQGTIDVVEPVLASGADRPRRMVGQMLVHLGSAYRALERHDRAIATFERVLEILPDGALAEALLVDAQIAAARHDAAIARVREARARHGEDLRFDQLEAQALLRSDRGTEAAGVLEAAVRRNETDPAAWIALSDLYQALDRHDEAYRTLETAEARFPEHTGVVFTLGTFYDRQERFMEAERAFRAVLEQDPEHAPALNHLGYILAERGERLEESVALIERALAVDPHNGSYLDSLGWAYFKLNRLDLAERYLRQAAAQLTSSSVVQDHLGDLLFARGAHAEAIDAWERALAGDGESIDRAEIEEKIRRTRRQLSAR